MSSNHIDVALLAPVLARDARAMRQFVREAKVIVDMSLGPDRTLTLSSPEPGRENETFEFKTKNHKVRKAKKGPTRATFAVARGAPRPQA